MTEYPDLPIARALIRSLLARITSAARRSKEALLQARSVAQGMIRNASVGQKLVAAIGILLGSLTLMGLAFSLQTRFIQRSVDKLVSHQDPKADAAYEMRIDLMSAQAALVSYLQDPEKDFSDRAARSQDQFMAVLRRYKDTAQSKDEKDLATTLAAHYQEWTSGAETLVYLKDQEREKAGSCLETLDRLERLVDDRIEAESKQRHWRVSQSLQLASELGISLKVLRKNLTAYLATMDPVYGPRIDKTTSAITRQLAAFDRLSHAPEEQAWMAKARRQFQNVKAGSKSTVLLLNKEIEQRELLAGERKKLGDILNDEIQKPLDASRLQARAALQSRLYWTGALVWILLILSLAFGLAVSMLTTRSIIEPIQRLIAGTEAAAAGNLAHRVQIDSKDELGKLADSFNQMLKDLERSRNALLEEIDGHRRTEKALRAKSEQLEATNRELEDFVFAASHDLQEPLRKVINYSELLQQRFQAKLDAEADRYLSLISRGSTRMMNLVRGLLSYSRITRQLLSVRAPVNAKKALEEAIADLEIAIKESGADIHIDPLPIVLADQSQIEELFLNLIGNAIKFRGPQPLRIRISASREQGFWKFRVQDNGIGFDPQYAERVFVIFQRLHPRDLYPGTGMGLAICKKIVERMGGRIWAESEVGKGSSFLFTLPAAAEVQQGEQTTIAAH